MKTILTLTLVLVAGIASATELKVPKGKSAMAKTPPPIVQPGPAGETFSACRTRIIGQCQGTHKGRISKYFTESCIRRNRWQCRGLPAQ